MGSYLPIKIKFTRIIVTVMLLIASRGVTGIVRTELLPQEGTVSILNITLAYISRCPKLCQRKLLRFEKLQLQDNASNHTIKDTCSVNDHVQCIRISMPIIKVIHY